MTKEVAIKVIRKMLACTDLTDRANLNADMVSACNLAIKALEQEPKKGHWIYDYTSADGHKTYHCSECACYLKPKHSEPLNTFKWCSLCGADMREVEEE